MDAFDHGLSLGADGLELDVHLSRDGVVVVHHDDTLDRTTDARGPLRVARPRMSSRASTRAIGSPRDPTAPRPRIRFADAAWGFPRCATCSSGIASARVIIELKTAESELARRTVDDVRAADALDRVALGSFHGRALQAARALRAAHSDRRRARRNALGALPLAAAVAARPHAVPRVPGSRAVGSDGDRHAAIHRARPPRRAARRIWTVDDPDDMLRLLEWGADSIISDRPDIAVPVVRAWAAGSDRGQTPV